MCVHNDSDSVFRHILITGVTYFVLNSEEWFRRPTKGLTRACDVQSAKTGLAHSFLKCFFLDYISWVLQILPFKFTPKRIDITTVSGGGRGRGKGRGEGEGGLRQTECTQPGNTASTQNQVLLLISQPAEGTSLHTENRCFKAEIAPVLRATVRPPLFRTHNIYVGQVSSLRKMCGYRIYVKTNYARKWCPSFINKESRFQRLSHPSLLNEHRWKRASDGDVRRGLPTRGLRRNATRLRSWHPWTVICLRLDLRVGWVLFWRRNLCCKCYRKLYNDFRAVQFDHSRPPHRLLTQVNEGSVTAT